MPDFTNDFSRDSVRVKVGGKIFEGWQRVNISRSLNKVASGFGMSFPRSKISIAPQGQQESMLPMHEGDRVQIFIGDDLVVTGHIDVIRARRSDEEHAFSIVGRSLTADLVDCSPLNKPGQWQNVPLLDIATDLAGPFGIRVISEHDDALRRVANFEIEQGEKVSEGLERLARMNSLLVRDNLDGDLVLGRIGTQRASVMLMHLDGPDGKPDPRNNVLKVSGSQSMAGRFSQITVRGQAASTDSNFGKVATSPSATAYDPTITRYRPLVLAAEGQANASDCQRRADWEIVRRLGKSRTASHEINGWRQGRDRGGRSGPLWLDGQIVSIQDSTLGLYGELVVADVAWSMDEKSGQRTTLKLEPIEAYQPKPLIEGSVDGAEPWTGLKNKFGKAG